jgi:predicted alpha/beta-hydrolase family hydrolase
MLESTQRPLILFAPGAGAPSSSGWMRVWARRLQALGVVERFDYPYMKAGRKLPDKQPVLVAAHKVALAAARAAHPQAAPVILCGKSMGSRMGCHLAVDEPAVAALVCFGYPLRSPAGTMRDAVLLALRTPILFVQGTRDELCPLDLLGEVRGRMRAPNQLFVVEGGDHSLLLPRRGLAPGGQEASDRAVLDAITTFLAPLVKAQTRRPAP